MVSFSTEYCKLKINKRHTTISDSKDNTLLSWSTEFGPYLILTKLLYDLILENKELKKKTKLLNQKS